MGNKTKQKVRIKTRNSKKVSRRGMSEVKKSEATAGTEPATERFVNDLLVRGEASGLAPNGKLPLEATHVIEKQNEDGTAAVRRVRYKLF
jgi:hypothetical protein